MLSSTSRSTPPPAATSSGRSRASGSDPVRSRRARALSILALVLMLAPLLAGCLRVQVSMGVSADDKVSGQIVGATPPRDDKDKGPQMKVPDSLGGKVRIQEYNQDGYVGSQAFFSGLSFGDVPSLGQLFDQSQGLFQIQLSRAGDLVSLTGKVDLKTVPTQGSDVQFTIAFPARVATTNGTRDGDSIVSWKLPPGDVTNIRAEVRYADPNTRDFAGWAGIVGGATLGIAGIVAALAYRTRPRQSPAATATDPADRWQQQPR